MKKRFILIPLILLLILPSIYANQFPDPTGFVNDFADILSPEEEQRLEGILVQLELDTSAEVVVVTVESLGGLNRERYAYDLATEWGIGKKGADNGLLLLVALKDREYRFEVGRGLEGTINDAKAGRIGRKVLVPYFKEEQYAEGILQAVLAIKGLIEKDPTIEAKFQETWEEKNYYLAVILYFLFVFLILNLFGRVFGKKKNAVWLGGQVLVLVSALFIGFSVLWAVFVIIFMFWTVFGPSRGLGGRYYGGRGSSGSGGGFGGFGGGGFGGGGAGGGW